MCGLETLLFVRLLGIVVGVQVPVGDKFWMLYMKLNVLDTCLNKSLSIRQGAYLRVLGDEFNSMFIDVTGETLNPKMHNLVHYGRVFDESGPVPLTSTKRFDSKHRFLLISARATEYRRDIARTVTIQHELNMFYLFKYNTSIIPPIEYGPVSEVFDRPLKL